MCYVHHNISRSSIVCVDVNNFNIKYEQPTPIPFGSVENIQQIAIDWVSNNFYFLDDREIIIVCRSTLDKCQIILEYDIKSPRAIALDPTRGYMYFTKWGQSSPMLERCRLDGSERLAIVSQKIVFPYGVTVDYPTNHIYWVDTYLDFIERVDYDGQNRKTILRGKIVQNLYGISIFENKIYVSSWYNNSILAIDKKTKETVNLYKSTVRPFNLHVYHQQKQPYGEYHLRFVTFFFAFN